MGMDDFNGRYILNEKGEPMPEPDLIKWATWFETAAERRVERTVLESGAFISTVFLGLDHSWDPDPLRDPLNYKPVLWETMAFEQGTHIPLFQMRYTSREEALAGHRRAVEAIKKKEETDAAELRGLIEAQEYVSDGESITCLTCGMTSYHPEDIRQKYCGHCHKYHEARK